jgi:hypothetical protein
MAAHSGAQGGDARQPKKCEGQFYFFFFFAKASFQGGFLFYFFGKRARHCICSALRFAICWAGLFIFENSGPVFGSLDLDIVLFTKFDRSEV